MKLRSDLLSRKTVLNVVTLAAMFLVAGVGSLVATTAGGDWSNLSATGGLPWDNMLNQVVKVLQGPAPKIIGLALIVVAGVMVAVSEGQGVKKLAWVGVGIGIALNATAIGSNFIGSGTGFLLG